VAFLIFRSLPRESKEGADGKLTRIVDRRIEAVPHTSERFFLELLLIKYPVQNFTHFHYNLFLAHIPIFEKMKRELSDHIAVCLSVCL
jgi:hypothetical protein